MLGSRQKIIKNVTNTINASRNTSMVVRFINKEFETAFTGTVIAHQWVNDKSLKNSLWIFTHLNIKHMEKLIDKSMKSKKEDEILERFFSGGIAN